MSTEARDLLIERVNDVLLPRLLWVLLPVRHQLEKAGRDRLAEIVSWASASMAKDVTTVLEHFEVTEKKRWR